MIQSEIIEQAINAITKMEKQMSGDGLFSILKDPDCNEGQRYNLAAIIKVNALLPQEVNILIRPWYRANALTSYWEQIGWSKKKTKAKTWLNLISGFEKMLNEQDDINQFFFGQTPTHPDPNSLPVLKQQKELINDFLSISFSNGMPYNDNFLIKYAHHSLFHMAERIGLEKDGRPYQINQYIDEIVGEKEYVKRNKIALSYREDNLLKLFYQNRNTLHRIIYNPYCKYTYKILRQIRLRRIFQNQRATFS